MLAHNQGSVQLHHRLIGYVLTLGAVALGFGVWRSRTLGAESRLLGGLVAGAILAQAGLGVATLMLRSPLGFAIAHQLAAALVFGLAIGFAWRVRRL